MDPKSVSNTLRSIATKIENSKSPSVSLVSKDLKRVIAALRVAGIPMHPATKEIEQALYDRSGAETDPNMQGSSIWWLVFNEIDMADWTPITDYAAVEKKAAELLNQWSKGWSVNFTSEEVQERIASDLEQLKENWESYQKHYMPEHIKLLEEKGLMGASKNPSSV